MMTRRGTTTTSNTCTNDIEALTEIQDVMKEFFHSNQDFLENVLTLQERSHEKNSFEDEVLGVLVLENFKPPPLVKFDGKSDPHEHISAINTDMVIIDTSSSLKCTILSITFKEASLRCHFSMTSYQEQSRKPVHQISMNKHQNVSTNNLFNVLQGHAESLREYLAHFN